MAMLSLFFHLLCVDLQIEVLQTWVGISDTNVACISALDIACCNKTTRPAFLSLISRPPGTPLRNARFGWSMDIDSTYLKWLHSRQVAAVRHLFIGEKMGFRERRERREHPVDDWTADMNEGSFRLAFIERMEVDLCTLPDHMETLLGACPNIKALIINRDGCRGESMWKMIARLPQMRLSVLDIGEACCNQNEICTALGMFGEHLLELRIRFATLTPAISEVIGDCCKQLTYLEITLNGLLASEGLLRMLSECKALTSFTCVGGCRGGMSPEDVHSILQLHQNWKSLTMRGIAWDSESEEAAVAAILEQCACLHSLVLGNWEIHHDTKVLHLPITSSTASHVMLSILEACRETSQLKITFPSLRHSNQEIMANIGRILGTTLKDVDVMCYHSKRVPEKDLLALVCLCPNLETLHGDIVLKTKEGLELLKRCCPKVIAPVVRGTSYY